jgi:hypothetical protein
MTRRPFLALIAAIAVFGTAGTAHANPSYFANGTTTSAATSSPAYMTPGTGTSTTPVFDAYAQTTNGGLTSKADYAGLLLQFSASSTASKLTGNVEYSQDGIDWYRNYLTDPIQVGTTTWPTFNVGTPFSLSWQFASSTTGGGAVASNSNRSTAAMQIPTPFRYTRIVFSMTGGNGAVWAQLVPIKERQ